MRPLIDERFHEAPGRAEARRELSLAPGLPVVLVSGGGWGLGDLAGATDTALAAVPDAMVLCLAGRSERARANLEARYNGNQRTRVLGFSGQMPELLAASDVLMHTTGGTTAIEARVVGCPLINYGTAVAHVRAHARALAEQGIAQWAPDRHTLGPAIQRALADGRPEPLASSGLPDAADLVTQLARPANHRAAAASASAAGPGS